MACKIISNSSKQPPRRGAVLLLTIVCVAVALAIMAALVQVALLRYATQQNHHVVVRATELKDECDGTSTLGAQCHVPRTFPKCCCRPSPCWACPTW